MAYTITKTWATGDIIKATEVQGELDAVRLYMSQVPSNAVNVSKWVDSKHIVRGEYDPVTNQARYVSGLFGGVGVLNSADFTYVTVYNTERGGTGTWQPLPGTSITMDVRRPITANINWWMSAKSSDNLSAGALGDTEIRLYTGNITLRHGEPVMVTEEDSTNLLHKKYRQVPGGFWQEDYTIGTYQVGLCGQSTTSKCMGFAWGISIEAFSL